MDWGKLKQLNALELCIANHSGQIHITHRVLRNIVIYFIPLEPMKVVSTVHATRQQLDISTAG